MAHKRTLEFPNAEGGPYSYMLGIFNYSIKAEWKQTAASPAHWTAYSGEWTASPAHWTAYSGEWTESSWTWDNRGAWGVCSGEEKTSWKLYCVKFISVVCCFLHDCHIPVFAFLSLLYALMCLNWTLTKGTFYRKHRRDLCMTLKQQQMLTT